MKLLFVGYLHGFGGAEKQLISLANEMVSRGNDVYLISLVANNQCYSISKEIKTIYIKDDSHFKIINRFLKFKKALKTINPDATINFWFQSAYFCVFAGKKYSGNIIYSERGDPSNSEYTGLLGLIRKIVLPRIDGFVFQTSGAKKFFDENVQKRSELIANPINIDKIKNIDFFKRKKKIVCVGRLHPQKNLPLVIKAFTNISDKYKDYKLCIYGDGEEKENISNLIQSLNMDKQIILMGTTKNIYDSIFDARLFILPSNYEGMPNALLEAMALGIPSISTDWSPGGVCDIISNNNNGIIVPCNDVFALEKAICIMLDDDAFAKKCSIESVKNSKKFFAKNIYDLWEKYIIRIINK